MTQPVRAGLNCTLSYADGAGVQQAFRLRVDRITRGLVQIYAESSGRTRRVLYPHRMSAGQFALGVLLSGQAERQALTSYLTSYTASVLAPGTGGVSAMSVDVPSRGFSRRGVPVAGMEWGDRLGQVLYRPQLVFETASDPQDTDPDPAASVAPGLGAVGDGAPQYFFPFGIQLSGDQAPAGTVLIPGASVLPDASDWGP